MIKIKVRLIIFVIIMLSLTAYTIYGGIMDNEEIAIRNAVDDFFDTIKNEIGEREVDIAIKESIKYQINEVNINNSTSTVGIELTGLDLAQSFYEMDMYHAFYREFSLNSRLLFTQPIMDSYEVYTYILTKNINNTQTSVIDLQLNKSNGNWNVVNRNDVYSAIENSSINLNMLTNKAYENLLIAKENARERYVLEQQYESFEEYWVEYLYDFITNAGYVTQYPFEEQQFMPNNP